MTIELQTGLPGACKTQYTLWRVEELRKASGRPVFYSGIPIFKEKLPDWSEIEADKWYQAPPEAIVIIDEAQRVFRPRASGSAIPRHESELETHRHGGIDLILITQGPKLVASNVRDLVGCHYHAVRRWGMQVSTIHQWPECKLNVQSRKDSNKKTFKFKKEVFTWYKSAEAHTIKRDIPMRIWLLLGVPLVLAALVFMVYRNIQDQIHPGQAATESHQPKGSAQGFVSSPAGPGANKVLTSAEYVERQRPRVAGLAYTAPAFDDVTKPVRAPYPAACVESKTRCQCYTQQGTRLEVPKELCSGIAAGGFFMAWDDRAPIAAQGLQVPIRPKETMEPLPGIINATPGYTPSNSAPIADQVVDGQNLRHGKNNRIPG